jgi:quinol monooxygenase YgiN
MIVEYVRYTIPDEQHQAFMNAYREASDELDASPHCLAYELSRCSEQSTRYVLRIEWDSLNGHLVGFRKGPSFPSFCAKVRPFFEHIDDMSHFLVTDIVSPRAVAATP